MVLFSSMCQQMVFLNLPQQRIKNKRKNNDFFLFLIHTTPIVPFRK